MTFTFSHLKFLDEKPEAWRPQEGCDGGEDEGIEEIIALGEVCVCKSSTV